MHRSITALLGALCLVAGAVWPQTPARALGDYAPIGQFGASAMDMEPAAQPAAQPALAPTPAPTAMPDVRVRFGDHADFSRAVFDWPSRTVYATKQVSNGIVITFPAARLDLSRFRADHSKFIDDITTHIDGDRAIVELKMPIGADFSHFRDGPRVVIDIRRSEMAAAAEIAEPKTANEKAAAPQPRESKEHTLKPSAPEAKDPQSAIADAAPDSPAMKAVPQPVVDIAELVMPTSNMPEIRPMADTGDPRFSVSAHRIENGLRLAFAWTEPVTATVVYRARHVWVFFGKPGVADLAAFEGTRGQALGDQVRMVQQIPSGNGTVLRFRFDKSLRPSVRREKATWIVEMRRQLTRPKRSVPVAAELTIEDGPRIFLRAVDSGDAIAVDDPEVGDRIIAVPLLEPGLAISSKRQFVQFALLRSAQGIVVQPKTSGLIVHPQRTGVVITSLEGLMLSRNAMGGGAAKPAVSEASLFRYEDWRQGPVEDFTDNERKLQYDVSRAPEAGRNGARIKLAQFYFAHDLAQEALGVMGRLEKDVPKAVASPEYRALRGATRYLARRYADARTDLFNADLDDDAESALWRGLLAVQDEDWEAARQQFAVGIDALHLLPMDTRARFRLAMADVDFATENYDGVAATVKAMDKEVDNRTDRSRMLLARARYNRLTGANEEALEDYKSLINNRHRPTQILAKLDHVNLLSDTGALNAADTIAEYERLRFAWRGDDIELGLLTKLGQRYIAAGRFRDGLSTLRQAVAFFPEDDGGRDVARRMNEVFADLFLNGTSDALAPINALGLYYDFRELTPVGHDGDTMIKKLADRLVSVDLLPKAAELLEHQINFRLSGAERAEVGTRLAIIYLLDREPEAALRSLRVSRLVDLPEDQATERRHLEVRALTNLSRFDQGLGLLRDDDSHKADLLRADIFWRSREWTKAASAFGTLLGDRWKSDDVLAPLERQQVMQLAVSYALAGDRAALDTLSMNYGALLDGLPEADLFNVITASDVDHDQTNFRELAGAIAQVNQLEAFMTAYRERLRQGVGGS